MQPGDLVHIELPDRIGDVHPYNTWDRCLALVVKDASTNESYKSWTVLVNGEMRSIYEPYLRKIDETR